MDKIIFLDRDGTINVEKNYLYKTEDFQFISGVPEAIKSFNDNGYRVVVVTNQAGVARGYYTEEDVKVLHHYIDGELEKYGAHIDRYMYCPHHPVNGTGEYKCGCNCRKPGTGMFEKCREYYDIDMDASWMIGDNKGDIGAGKNFGIKTILVGTGYGKQLREEGYDEYDYYASDLAEAARLINQIEVN